MRLTPYALGIFSSLLLTTNVIAAPAAPNTTPAPANPQAVVATVNGEKITLSDVQGAMDMLPPQLRQLPSTLIYPMLVNQLVDQKAILFAAHKENLEKKPDAQKAIRIASENALQNVWLSQQVMPHLTDKEIKQYYDQNYVNKPPEKEIHARHILVKTDAEARDAISKLKNGADFGKLAALISTDKGSASQNGGDLGWFKKGDMIPAFSDAAFAMKPNEYSTTPVKSQYGYHIIQVLDVRTQPVPPLDSIKDKIRQTIIQKYVREALEKAIANVKVTRYDITTGKPIPQNNPLMK